MRNVFKNICLAFLLGMVIMVFQSCGSKANNKEVEESTVSLENEEIDNDKSCCDKSFLDATVKVYYFHATRRCATCEAVEKISKEYIKEFYAGKVSFVSINREEEQNLELVEKYEIAGQTLLIVFDSVVVNLTTEAFLNARSNPEKLKELIKLTIDSRLI